MTLVIDIGNTNTKIAVFKQDELLHVEQYQHVGTGKIDKLLNDYPAGRAIISTVKKENADWETRLAEKIPLIYFTREMAKGIVNHYGTPETLGLDRLAAVIGVHYLYPGENQFDNRRRNSNHLRLG